MSRRLAVIPPEPLEPSKPRKPLVKAVIASKAPRLSEHFTNLIGTLSAHPVQLREILALMHARAYTLLPILLALPFCLPIPLPGFSTPFGVVIALIGGLATLQANICRYRPRTQISLGDKEDHRKQRKGRPAYPVRLVPFDHRLC